MVARSYDFAWVHDVVGIERLLDAAHELDLDRGLVADDVLASQPANAVLGADAAVLHIDDVVHDPAERQPTRQEFIVGHILRPVEIEMDVAVADMAERNDADAGQGLRDRGDRLLDEGGHARHGDGDVVLDAGARKLLQFDHRLAYEPQPARLLLAPGNRRVGDDSGLERVGDGGFERGAQAALDGGCAKLDQHIVIARFLQWVDDALDIAPPQLDADARDQLEARDGIAARRAAAPEQLDRRVEIAHGGEGRDAVPRLGKELEDGRRDDAEGALGADEDLLQVVAGVVLAQRAQPV